MPTPSKTPKKASKSSARGERTTVAVEPGVRKLLATAAKETQHTHMEYASAAIRYFAERGLDPVTNHEREGAVIQKRIGDVEELVVSLGNRLFGWLTQHEKNLNKDLFSFLRGHEKSLFDYLQQQEQNVHEHLSDQEEFLLHPLIRELMVTNVEALYGRRLGEQIMLKVLGREIAEYPAKHQEFNQRRDHDAKEKHDKFFTALQKTGTLLAPVPQATPLPAKAQPLPKAAPATPPEPTEEEPYMKF